LASLKLYFALGFFSLILLIPQTAFSQQIEPESSPILESGIISTKNNDYIISNDFDIRQFFYGKILRISGTTIDGNFYYVYHKIIDDEIFLKGKIFLDGKFVPLEFNKEPEQVTKESSMPLEQPEMKILVKQTERVYWKQNFDITIRVFNAELNRLNDFDQNWGYIPGIDILVEIFNEDDELLTSLSGQTGNTGYYDAEYYIVENLISRGDYIVNVTADNGQVQLTKTLPLYIFGERPDGGSSGP